MITLIQRVKSAHVEIDNETTGKISTGLLLYLGFEESDDTAKINWVLNKILNLRIFSDENGKMNKSLLEVSGEILLVPNFTLPADLMESGRRPSFTKSLHPGSATKLFNETITSCKNLIPNTKSGVFGADMKVHSICDGPVNFILRR